MERKVQRPMQTKTNRCEDVKKKIRCKWCTIIVLLPHSCLYTYVRVLQSGDREDVGRAGASGEHLVNLLHLSFLRRSWGCTKEEVMGSLVGEVLRWGAFLALIYLLLPIGKVTGFQEVTDHKEFKKLIKTKNNLMVVFSKAKLDGKTHEMITKVS